MSRTSKLATSLSVAAAAVQLGCVVGAPPGFSSGDVWTVPLVAPLESDVLLVPVKINDAGPYLFMIDPDAAVSSIDNVIANELQLYTVQGREEINEADQKVPVFQSEVKAITVGTLTVKNRTVRAHKAGTYWAGGRRVRGVLGRDVIADSLIFSADRDRGIATLATQGNLAPPANAVAIKYRRFYGRRLAKVLLDGRTELTMHIDLGGPASQLWTKKMDSLGLGQIGVRRRMTDDYGTVWEVSTGATLGAVQLASARVDNVVVVPFSDGRLEEQDLDGALGQNVLSRFNIVANWHKKTIWLSPRNPNVVATASERIRRWSGVFQGCKNEACVEVTVIGERPPEQPPVEAPAETIPQQPGAPPSAQDRMPNPGYQLHIEREPSLIDITYEVLLEAVDASGKPIGLPRILATLPRGVRTLTDPKADPNYGAAAGFKVVDVSPFPRDCDKTQDGATQCIWQQAIDR